MFVALLIAGVLATDAAAPAVAPEPVGAAHAKPATPGLTYAPPKAADQKDDQLVCTTQAVLGSRMPVRRCRTVGDIKDRSLNDRQMVEHAQSNLQWRSN